MTVEFFELADGNWRPRVFVLPYPFIRGEFHGLDEDGPYVGKTWNPGVNYEPCSPEDSEAIADGVGQIEYTVVSHHTRCPVDTMTACSSHVVSRLRPAIDWFGKRRLHVMTVQAFRRRLRRGFPVHYAIRNGGGSQ